MKESVISLYQAKIRALEDDPFIQSQKIKANNNSINIAKFFGCFQKKLVIADAFLTGYENFLLNKEQNQES